MRMGNIKRRAKNKISFAVKSSRKWDCVEKVCVGGRLTEFAKKKKTRDVRPLQEIEPSQYVLKDLIIYSVT